MSIENEKKKEKASKIWLVAGIIGIIASIVSIIMNIINPNVSSYQDFFERSWFAIFILVVFVIPTITSNITAFSKKKNKNKIDTPRT